MHTFPINCGNCGVSRTRRVSGINFQLSSIYRFSMSLWLLSRAGKCVVCVLGGSAGSGGVEIKRTVEDTHRMVVVETTTQFRRKQYSPLPPGCVPRCSWTWPGRRQGNVVGCWSHLYHQYDHLSVREVADTGLLDKSTRHTLYYFNNVTP